MGRVRHRSVGLGRGGGTGPRDAMGARRRDGRAVAGRERRGGDVTIAAAGCGLVTQGRAQGGDVALGLAVGAAERVELEVTPAGAVDVGARALRVGHRRQEVEVRVQRVEVHGPTGVRHHGPVVGVHEATAERDDLDVADRHPVVGEEGRQPVRDRQSP